ncbi:MAG: DNA alkylation repair protein [Clostridia bacterium]|nr:DNA alkylation repair protein [Clostridia bacterium]
MTDIHYYIEQKLKEMADPEYKEFHQKLMPTVNPEKVLGVRVPDLRKFAKEINKTDLKVVFLKKLPHKYYEENNLHAFLIEMVKDYNTVIKELNRFLPFVDNWATCDMMSPKIFKKHKKELLEEIEKWINSDEAYTIRYGIKCLMQYYLDDEFDVSFLQMVADIKSDEYYVNMMRAWYFATALSKQYEVSVKFLENRSLDKWTHNKTISKAVESHCVTPENKEYLKALKY